MVSLRLLLQTSGPIQKTWPGHGGEKLAVIFTPRIGLTVTPVAKTAIPFNTVQDGGAAYQSSSHTTLIACRAQPPRRDILVARRADRWPQEAQGELDGPLPNPIRDAVLCKRSAAFQHNQELLCTCAAIFPYSSQLHYYHIFGSIARSMSYSMGNIQPPQPYRYGGHISEPLSKRTADRNCGLNIFTIKS